MSKFKVGDRVKVVRNDFDNGEYGWNKAMDDTEGKIGRTVYIEDDEFCEVEIEDSHTQWAYVEANLELVSENEKALELTADHPIQEVFNDVIYQLTSGNGNERHGNGKDFMEQPWVSLAEIHGRGFLTGQSEKKLREAQSMGDPERWEREMFGVIAYASMAIIYDRKHRLEK